MLVNDLADVSKGGNVHDINDLGICPTTEKHKRQKESVNESVGVNI